MFTTLQAIKPLSLTGEYQSYETQDPMGFDWEPADSHSAVPVESLQEFVEDYDDAEAVALMLQAMKLELSEAAYSELLSDIDDDTLECPYSVVGWLQGAGYVTMSL